MCIVLCKIGTCSCKKVVRKSAMTGEKDSSGESGDLHCVIDRKTTVYGLEACEIAFIENAC